MKKRRFLAYIAAIVASVSVIVGCSDNNEPPFEPTPEPSGAETKNDSEYKYPTDTIIYVDERTEDEKEISGGGFLIFKEESFKNYGVVVTRKVGGGKYEIYIPAEGANLSLETEYNVSWLKALKSLFINGELNELSIEILSEYYEDPYGNKYDYFYKATHENLTVIYDTPNMIHFKVPANTTGEELHIETGVSDPPIYMNGATIIFIQAAK